MHVNLAIVNELACLASHYNKTWCYPSQQTLLDRLRKYHGQEISRRTLNRHLALLVAGGWLRRIIRHQRDKITGDWTFRSTLYVLSGRAWRYFASLAKTVAKSLGFFRVPLVAHNVTSCINNGPAARPSPPGQSKSVPPAGWREGLNSVLHKK